MKYVVYYKVPTSDGNLEFEAGPFESYREASNWGCFLPQHFAYSIYPYK